LRVLFALIAHRTNPFRIHLPGLSHPVWLRANTTDKSTLFHVFVYRDYDISELKRYVEFEQRYTELVKSGNTPLIIDCGAYIGLSAVWFASRFPHSRVLAIEPSDDNLEIARRNCAPYPNIELLKGAVWDTPEQIAIVNPSGRPWSYRVAPSQNGLRAYTINELSDRMPIFIVKINIEGAEKALFRSNTSWFVDTDLVIAEPHDWLFPGQGITHGLLKLAAINEREVVVKGPNLVLLRPIKHWSSSVPGLDAIYSHTRRTDQYPSDTPV
jgi:FkbM family methyltransferase